MAYDIFISYRRKGGADKARPLKSEFERRGYSVFLDFDELKDGVFDKRIMDAIDDAPIFLIILSAHSLDRCNSADDWVRKEIEYAIEKRRHVIPVDPNKEFDGFPADIPEALKAGLGQHQFSHIDFEQLFKVSIDKMISERIEPLLTQTNHAANRNGALVRIDADLECRVMDFGKEIARIGVGLSEIRLSKGKHQLSMVGVESDAERYDCMLDIRDLEYEEYVEVRLLDQYNARKEAERKAEAERKVKEAAENAAKEKAEAERRAKEAIEKTAKEKVRLAQEAVKKIYKVGDYYNDGTKEGVVFCVDESGKHGKIVSMQQSEELPWAVDKNFGTFFNKSNPCKQEVWARKETYGLHNMQVIMKIDDWRMKYPAFAWCADLGESWYLPAIEELKLLLLNELVHDAVNKTLESRGATTLFNKGKFAWYWSSTEYSEFCAWGVRMSGGYTRNGNKSYNYYVRAVSAF